MELVAAYLVARPIAILRCGFYLLYLIDAIFEIGIAQTC